MPKAYFKGDNVFVNDVDVTRAARKLRQLLKKLELQAELHPNTSLDLIAQAIGYASHHALRSEAHNDRDGDSGRDPLFALAKEALKLGESFPKELPERFGKVWREKAVALFDQAIKRRVPGRCEVVALVGKAASGKTVLARHMAKMRGGAVLDATLTNQSIPIEFCKPDAVLVYDRPAILPDQPPSFPNMPSGKVGLEYFRQSVRGHFNPFDMFGLYSRLLKDVEMYPETHFVVGLPSDDDVSALLTSSIRPGIGKPGAFIWQAVHVVNLDTQTGYTLEPPSLQDYHAELTERRKSEAS